MQAAKNHTKLTATQTIHLTWPSHQRDKTFFHSPEPGTTPSYQKVSLTKGQTLEAKEATILHRAERRPQTELNKMKQMRNMLQTKEPGKEI